MLFITLRKKEIKLIKNVRLLERVSNIRTFLILMNFIKSWLNFTKNNNFNNNSKQRKKRKKRPVEKIVPKERLALKIRIFQI